MKEWLRALCFGVLVVGAPGLSDARRSNRYRLPRQPRFPFRHSRVRRGSGPEY